MDGVEEIRKAHMDQINEMVKNGESPDRLDAAFRDMNQELESAANRHIRSAEFLVEEFLKEKGL